MNHYEISYSQCGDNFIIAFLLCNTRICEVDNELRLESQSRGDCRLLRVVEDYWVPNLSEKVVRIIACYTGM
jgi:hypothetical protein